MAVMSQRDKLGRLGSGDEWGVGGIAVLYGFHSGALERFWRILTTALLQRQGTPHKTNDLRRIAMSDLGGLSEWTLTRPDGVMGVFKNRASPRCNGRCCPAAHCVSSTKKQLLFQ